MPADTNLRAKRIVDFATGENPDLDPDPIKNKAAVELGKLGGEARAKKLTPKKRTEIAKKAAQKRWS